MLNRSEIWKDVPNYEGLYQVSNLGNIKSLKYGRTGEERILKPGKNSDGYLQVILCKNGKRKTYYVHRLVALSFLPNPNNLKEINHKDENPLNNCVNNLEWCDRKYNCNYGTRTKRLIATRNKNCSYSAEKSVVQLSKDGVKIEKYKSLSEASRQTGIPHQSIGKCCKGRLKSAGNFVWKYAI